ncbi:hypothetical protein Dimus_028674 [Dionaea muscipula]
MMVPNHEADVSSLVLVGVAATYVRWPVAGAGLLQRDELDLRGYDRRWGVVQVMACGCLPKRGCAQRGSLPDAAIVFGNHGWMSSHKAR